MAEIGRRHIWAISQRISTSRARRHAQLFDASRGCEQHWEGEIFFSDAIRRGARALSRSLGEMAAEREAALAALLAEIDADPGGESVPTASGSGDLRLGDDLDITTTDRTEDAFKQLLDGEAGLDVELIKYADHDVVRNIMRGEASDLRQRAKEVTDKLRAVELESIQDYVGESENLLALRAEIDGCDDILASMESLLSTFKGDLGAISGEIKSLQEQSLGMAAKLRNRRAAEARLGAFVQSLTVPPDLIRAVVEDDVSESYLKHLADLDRRLAHMDADDEAKASAASGDVRPELERLRAAAARKTREFLVQKLYSLRKPKTNIQILQQNVLLKYKYAVTFLRRRAPEILTEVRACYIETMSRVLEQALRGYVGSLARLQQSPPRELLASEQGLGGGGNGGGGFFGNFAAGGGAGGAAAATAMKHRASMFSLGDRRSVLDAIDTAPPLIVHQAETSGAKFPHERLFRSSQKLFMDTATFEYLFCNEFWAGDPAVFDELFAAPLAVMEEQVKLVGTSAGPGQSLLGAPTASHDAVGLLLMIRVNRAHQHIMSRRRVPVLDKYLDGVNLTLWPRFKAAFDAHLKSATEAVASPTSVQALWSDDVHAHYVARRYAEFAAAMATLGEELSGDGQLESNLERLRAAVERLLDDLASKFTRKTRKAAFLVNNCDCVRGILSESLAARRSGNGEASASGDESLFGKTLAHFEQRLAAHSDAFIEEELAGHFQPLIAFVRRVEAKLKAEGTGGGGGDAGEGSGAANPGDLAEAANLMRDFGERWKVAVEKMHADVISQFGNLQRGMEILQRTLSQLLIYYNRFSGPEGVLAKMGPEADALRADAVSNPAFMYEIKRHSQSRIS